MFTTACALHLLIESLNDPPHLYYEEITIEGYKLKQPIYFYWYNTLEVIKYIFGHPHFMPYMQYDPHRDWTNESRTEHIYSEYMMGDFTWQSQVCLSIN
jgi:hypothetical protein